MSWGKIKHGELMRSVVEGIAILYIREKDIQKKSTPCRQRGQQVPSARGGIMSVVWEESQEVVGVG